MTLTFKDPNGGVAKADFVSAKEARDAIDCLRRIQSIIDMCASPGTTVDFIRRALRGER